jgi:hypothetical protein
MTPTLLMIRAVIARQVLRDVPRTMPTRFDERLSRLLAYLRYRHHRDTGRYSPV